MAVRVAGALAMAAGEYVSVSSQRDTGQVDGLMKRQELEQDPEPELQELTSIYGSVDFRPLWPHRSPRR